MSSASFLSPDARKLRRQLPQLRRRGASLLHQQCWLWGCDIRRAEGNLLLAYGFTRQADPAGKRSTQYTLHRDDGSIARLWGSGFYFGDAEEGIFLNRFAFEPRLVRFAEEWQDPARLKEAPRYFDFRCLRDACAWIAEYELWLSQKVDEGYRHICLLSGPNPAQEASSLSMMWRELAAEMAQLCESSAQRIR